MSNLNTCLIFLSSTKKSGFVVLKSFNKKDLSS